MQDHEKRVVIERDELREKREKLVEFFLTGLFQSLQMEDRELLIKQQDFMLSYEDVLNARISRFNAES